MIMVGIFYATCTATGYPFCITQFGKNLSNRNIDFLCRVKN